MAYDLILQNDPAREQGRANVSPLIRALWEVPAVANSCQIGAGNDQPNAIDAISLEEGLEEGEFSLEEFQTFCKARNLTPVPENLASASAFLDAKRGTYIASVKLPTAKTDVIASFSALLAFAKQHQLRLVDPQAGQDIDLEAPGLVPPMWE